MRLTTGSVVAAMTIVFLVLSFWPDGDRAIVPSADAQQQQQAAASPDGSAETAKDKTAANGEPTISENNKATEKRLASRIDVGFHEVPVSDVLDYISDLLSVQFHTDRAALEEIGIDGSEPVTLSLKRVRGDMALDLVLDPLSLVYVIRDGIAIVTTKERIQSNLEVRVYNCRDLLQLAGGSARGGGGAGGGEMGGYGGGGGLAGEGGSSGFGGMEAMGSDEGMGMGMQGSGSRRTGAADDLMQLVQATVASDTWEAVGGYGTIEQFGGLLVIDHDPHTHRLVERVLDMMRTAMKKDPGAVVTPND